MERENTIRISSFNVNGLRACLKRKFQTAAKLVTELDSDIICLQETKLTKNESIDDLIDIPGYDCIFNTSSSSRGYSGTVTYVRSSLCQPYYVEIGFTTDTASTQPHPALIDHFTPQQLDELDAEGRVVITHHYHCSHHHNNNNNNMNEHHHQGQPSLSSSYTGFVLFNIYAPAITNEETAAVRMLYKLNFYKALQLRWAHFLQQGIPVIVVGDMNIAPAPNDYPDPESEEQFYRKDRPDRIWLRNLLTPSTMTSTTVQQQHTEGRIENTISSLYNNEMAPFHFKDAFRVFHPDRKHAFTVWNTQTNSRVHNYGSRIDLVLVSGLPIMDTTSPAAATGGADVDNNNNNNNNTMWVSGSDIQPDIEGSDHCPIWVNVSWNTVVKFPCAENAPKAAARWAVGGRQTKVKDFLTKKRKGTAQGGVGEGREREKGEVVEVVKKSGGTGSSNERGGKQQQQQGSIKSWFSKSTSNYTSLPTTTAAPVVVAAIVKDSTALETTTTPVSTFLAEEVVAATKLRQEEAKAAWQHIHAKMTSIPKCLHNEDAVMKRVNKSGPNKGRFFYTCGRAEGPKPEGKCDYFKWVVNTKGGSGVKK